MGCTSDADCTAQPHGRCDDLLSGPPGGGCGCSYGCETDADCAAGQACGCDGEGVLGRPRCMPQDCASSDDCADGLCVLAWQENSCDPGYQVACTTPDDTCTFDTDCNPFEGCYPTAGPWTCGPEDCA
ncbi:MAG: hypothetical protein K0V04_19245 [Deltaproteobacteria bacterium]|nr:hypothetical protein [Deltaproteobacteria bacterium]